MNRLLAAFSPDDLALLEPHLESMHLPVRFVFETPNKPIEYVYFPETCVASAVATNGKDERIEVGLIGCEGMSGLAIVMGQTRSPQSIYIQMPGRAQRVRAEKLQDLLQANRSLQTLMLKFAQVFMTQTAQTAVANGRAELPIRLARWLLMAHDRTVNDNVPLTHEFLALMLGVRRASVTVVMHGFEKKDFIAVRRGEITVMDRVGLEKAAGSFYGVPEAEYQRLIG